MKSGHLLEVVCQMCAVPVSSVYKRPDTSKRRKSTNCYLGGSPWFDAAQEDW